MDYLRTLGSAAVSTLVQKSGINLPFSLAQKVAVIDGVCNLYDATKRDDGSPVSVFEYDFNDPSKRNYKPLAKNALRKLRTTRHPDVLKFMDAVESDTNIYIMTERVVPLDQTLQQWTSRSGQEREDWLLWGLHRISVALAFINDPCASTHGSINTSSIFISPSGEWKLGGFELCSNPKDEAATLYTMGSLYPGSSAWSSPEVRKSGWNALKEGNVAAGDAYALGLFLHSVFNPNQPPPATFQPPHTPPTANSRGAIPVSVFNVFKKLLNPNPSTRLTSKGFLDVGMADGGFFSSNRLVKVCGGLDNFALANEAEKNLLIRTLKESSSSFPSEFVSFKVLPSLVSAMEYGGASAAAILPLVLQFSKNVSPEDYPNVILAPILKLYASPDRGTRMALLDHLPEYVDKLDQKVFSDKIFPHFQTGFSDTVAVIREATVKSIILLAPKMSSRILNNELLRHLAKMQMDPEASIRTNTCILIGRLGPTLGYNTKRKVLVPAFVRALKDSFVHARVAGLMSFMATIDCFEVDEIATKVIANIAPALVDKEKLVRDQAFKAVDLFVTRLGKHAETMPETEYTNGTLEEVPYASPASSALVNSATGAAGALAGWAISSIGKKLATADLQTTMSTPSNNGDTLAIPGGFDPGTGSTVATPIAVSFKANPGLTNSSSSSSNLKNPTLTKSPPGGMKSKGMKLGGNGGSGSTNKPDSSWLDELGDDGFGDSGGVGTVDTADDWGDLDGGDVGFGSASVVGSNPTAADTNGDGGESNPWGDDDLMDVNADEGDWTAFKTAPVRAALKSSALTPKRTVSTAASTSQHSSPSVTPSPHAPSTVLTAASGGAGPVSKEDRAVEMARRKEERKQRIAALKEQKKAKA